MCYKLPHFRANQPEAQLTLFSPFLLEPHLHVPFYTGEAWDLVSESRPFSNLQCPALFSLGPTDELGNIAKIRIYCRTW